MRKHSISPNLARMNEQCRFAVMPSQVQSMLTAHAGMGKRREGADVGFGSSRRLSEVHYMPAIPAIAAILPLSNC